ncbi:Hypothetical_protein [Hexamita inflata]|uniref:Hypothetical_protein n=1 Tax=Hexamita inflata TaxID=28002 RepID=A0AA86QZK8_9EUKA|nr:Hypothetical protein HINF_LOCUS50543 [Hexamita inflata]
MQLQADHSRLQIQILNNISEVNYFIQSNFDQTNTVIQTNYVKADQQLNDITAKLNNNILKNQNELNTKLVQNQDYANEQIALTQTNMNQQLQDLLKEVERIYLQKVDYKIAPEEVKLELLKFNFIIKFIYSYFQEYMQIPRQKLSQKMKYYPNTENILIVKSNIKGKEAINTKISILNKLIYFLITGRTTLIKKSENLIMI